MGRVAALGAALRTAEEDTRGGEDKTVRVDADGGPSLVFEDLHLAEPDGRLLVSGFSATIGPGERVLADGDPTAAFALFMATARLWPWGRGRIGLPATSMAFVASAPFLPRETLRALLSFPDPPDGLSDRSMSDALATVGLGRLSGRLDERIDPERALGTGDRQRLDLARIVLRRPPWVIMSAPCDALPPEDALAVVGAVVAALPADATVVLCGGRAVFADLATRRVTVPHATTDRLFERPPPVRRGRFGRRSPAGREDGTRRLP
jgi:putative ATP-binding cassette transporter